MEGGCLRGEELEQSDMQCGQVGSGPWLGSISSLLSDLPADVQLKWPQIVLDHHMKTWSSMLSYKKDLFLLVLSSLWHSNPLVCLLPLDVGTCFNVDGLGSDWKCSESVAAAGLIRSMMKKSYKSLYQSIIYLNLASERFAIQDH